MTPCPLWDFALEHYSREGVAPLCLTLQERHGADVNMLFLALWLAERSRVMRAGALPPVGISDWHVRVVRSLRAARKAMKNWPMPPDGPTAEERDAARAQVQSVEIETERLELGMLRAWAEKVNMIDTTDQAAARLANLRAVLPAAADDPELARLAALFGDRGVS